MQKFHILTIFKCPLFKIREYAFKSALIDQANVLLLIMTANMRKMKVYKQNTVYDVNLEIEIKVKEKL